jgi:hypothetical protein
VRGNAYLPNSPSSKPPPSSAKERAKFLEERAPASPSEISTEMKEFNSAHSHHAHQGREREREDDPPLLLSKRSTEEKVSRDSSLSLTSSLTSHQERARLLGSEGTSSRNTVQSTPNGATRADSSVVSKHARTFGSYEKKPWAIYPDNHMLKVLDISVILATVYNAFIVPVRICIEPNVFGDFTVHICDYVADLVFIADMVSRFFRVKFESGLLIDNLTEIKRSYLHGRFFFDVLFCSPYDAIFLLFPATRKVHIYFRITRLYFLTKVRDKIDQWEKLLNYNTVTLRIVALSFWVVLLAHWIGCFFFLVGGRGHNEDSWIAADGMHPGTPTYRKWLR